MMKKIIKGTINSNECENEGEWVVEYIDCLQN